VLAGPVTGGRLGELAEVRFAVGGPAPQAAAQVAGLLCASADLEGLPYALRPMAGCAALERSWTITALQDRCFRL